MGAVSIHRLRAKAEVGGRVSMSLGQWRFQLSFVGLYLPHFSPGQQHIPYWRHPDGREGPGKSWRC